jgi:two-component system, OmpR family, response regulator RpaA
MPSKLAPPTRPLVLVIEDDSRIQELLEEMLTGSGYRVQATDSALGAAALVRRLRPDAVLLDLGLPYRSGATVLQEIKHDPQTLDVPVVILSAMTETLTRERRALADAVLSKPVSLNALLTTLRRITTRRAA